MPEEELPPKLQFGFVVLSPSQAIVIKPGTPYALAYIGQTLSIKQHFVEPHNVSELYNIYPDGRRRCQCEIGRADMVPADLEDLYLREPPV